MKHAAYEAILCMLWPKGLAAWPETDILLQLSLVTFYILKFSLNYNI